MRLLTPLGLLPLALVAACGSSETPGGVTAAENKALDEAAEMVEAKQLPANTLPPAPKVQASAPLPSGN